MSLRRVETAARCHLTSKRGSQNSNPVLLGFKSHPLTILGGTLVKLLPTLKCNHHLLFAFRTDGSQGAAKNICHDPHRIIQRV